MRRSRRLGAPWRVFALGVAVFVAADCAAPSAAEPQSMAAAGAVAAAPVFIVDTLAGDGPGRGGMAGTDHEPDRQGRVGGGDAADALSTVAAQAGAGQAGATRPRAASSSLARFDRSTWATSPWPLVMFAGIPEDPVAHDRPVLVTWSESRAAGEVASRTLITEQAPFLNGACAPFSRVSAVPAPVTRVAAQGLLESGQCYRWTVHMAMENLDTSDQVSRPLWVASPPPPFFRFDLLGEGMYSPQQTWTWCTAASVQMMRNMVHGATDTSYATQLAIINFEQAHDRYPFAVPGSDPQGMVAALAEFGVGSYHWVKGTNSDDTLREAAMAMRVSRKPVALFVAWGSHAWVMSGFTSDVDPLVDDDWRLIGVFVEGPLYPLQALRNGFYDPPPDQWYSVETMRKVMLPYWETTAPSTSIWQGAIVAVIPDLP